MGLAGCNRNHQGSDGGRTVVAGHATAFLERKGPDQTPPARTFLLPPGQIKTDILQRDVHYADQL